MIALDLELSVTENGRKAPKYSLDTDLNGEISLADLLEFTKASLIIIADETLKEEQAKGFDKKPVLVVDGKTGKSPLNVSPLGSIEFISRQNIDEIILETYEGILGRSPEDTGEYKKHHLVFLNGKEVARDLSSLKAWLKSKAEIKDADLIRIVNIQPYARKLERLGVTAGNGKFSSRSARYSKSKDKRGRSGGKILAPNGSYFLTYRSVQRKYKRNSSIKFSFIPGSQLGLSAVFKTVSSGARGGGRGKAKKAKPSTYLYPSISIYATERGLV